MRPTSSVASRKAGAPEETVGALCAREGAAQDKKAARAAQAALLRRGQTGMFMNLPRPEILCNNKKSPTRHPGACGIALSREEYGPHQRGRVAWLTAFQPITVAGPRPIHTAFPASRACKLKFQCMRGWRVCQMRACNPPRFSDSSSWASVSRPARADLLASLPNDKVHSRKYSSNA